MTKSRRRAVRALYQHAQREAALRLLSAAVDVDYVDYVSVLTDQGDSRWVQTPPGSGKWRGLMLPLREQ
jgi:hypothetical protein